MTLDQRRLVRFWLTRALREYLQDNNRQGDASMDNALTFATPVGKIILQTYN